MRSVALSITAMFSFASGAIVGPAGSPPASMSLMPEVGYGLEAFFIAAAVSTLTLGSIDDDILQDWDHGWLSVKVFAAVGCPFDRVVNILGQEALHGGPLEGGS